MKNIQFIQTNFYFFMSVFSRYYVDSQLKKVSMADMEKLIENETNKNSIADYIFHRYYERFIKPFEYQPKNDSQYTKEYKSGFAIMACCVLVIESLATYLQGENKSTAKTGDEAFRIVFKKANDYKNGLAVFTNLAIYKNVRNGLLHQGETYDKFLIRRTGELYNATTKVINATRFLNELKVFLASYSSELKNAKWDGELWDNCRVKLRHIIRNSKI